MLATVYALGDLKQSKCEPDVHNILHQFLMELFHSLFFPWNPFLKTDAASLLNLFSVKNPKQDSMKIIME